MELVIGGSGSGKSAYAESVICGAHRRDCGNPPLYYIADMMPYGAETEKKIENHRRMRAGKGFRTLEWYLDLPGKLSGESSVRMRGAYALLECISNLTANEMYEADGAGERTVESITAGVGMLRKQCSSLVVVTNDVFGECGPDSAEMEIYKRYLSAVNRRLAEMADRVTEVVYGVPVTVKAPRSRENMPGHSEKKEERYSMIHGIHLVTGGAYQGKEQYAYSLYPDAEWSDGRTCPLSAAADCRAMKAFHVFIRRWLKEGYSKEELLRAVAGEKRDIVLICDEVGCGLVPVDDFEREYREAAGRICTGIAEKAVRVDRVICGIGTRIK